MKKMYCECCRKFTYYIGTFWTDFLCKDCHELVITEFQKSIEEN